MLNALIFSLILDVGFQPEDQTILLDNMESFAYIHDKSAFCSIRPRAEFKEVYLEGDVLTQATKSRGCAWFAPYQMTYSFEIGFVHKIIGVGFSHSCSHSVTCSPARQTDDFITMDALNTKIFARFKFSTATQ